MEGDFLCDDCCILFDRDEVDELHGSPHFVTNVPTIECVHVSFSLHSVRDPYQRTQKNGMQMFVQTMHDGARAILQKVQRKSA